MNTITFSAAAALTAAAVLGLQGPATARSRHHHPFAAVAGPPPTSYAQARDPAEFYPEQIEGGVRGNLSFNNQIRKHTDPLNANGGGG